MGSNPIGGSYPPQLFVAFLLKEGVRIMAKKGNRLVVKLKSTESGHMYITYKNRRNDPNRLELKKYDPLVRRHVLYRETK
jgi:large subunit ribosomal protein L33